MMKLVNEEFNFERTGNVKSSLGIGKKAVIRKFFRDLDIPDSYYNIYPDGEIVYEYVLNLENTNITELPNNLIVFGNVILTSSTIKVLPNKLTVNGNLYLMYTDITELPEDLNIKGYIYTGEEQDKLIDFIENSKFEDKLIIWFL